MCDDRKAQLIIVLFGLYNESLIGLAMTCLRNLLTQHTYTPTAYMQSLLKEIPTDRIVKHQELWSKLTTVDSSDMAKSWEIRHFKFPKCVPQMKVCHTALPKLSWCFLG